MAGGWRDMVKDAVAAKGAETATKHRGASGTANISRVGFSRLAHPFLVRAARKRGISISGYIRRATMAVVAVDLGIDPRKIFEVDTGITPLGRIGSAPSKDLDGELYGPWRFRVDDDPASDS